MRANRAVSILVVSFVFSLVRAELAAAGEITIFVSRNQPAEIWSYGQGAALTMRMFRVLLFDIEAARNSTKADALATTTRMTYFTGSIGIAVPLPKITPYLGIGAGLFHQRREPDTDIGTLQAELLGFRLRLADLIVLKAEYRRFHLSSNPLLAMDDRLSIGAGIAF